MLRHRLASALAVVALGASAAVASHSAHAVAAFTFTTPDAPLPSASGNGLNAKVWTGVDVDSLAAAEAFIGANPADATFLSSAIDYPQGASNVVGTSTLFSDLLGSDASTLSNPAVGSTSVLNSILQFDGFLRIDTPGSVLLSIGSDDGSEAVIQGTRVIDNDGIHAFPGGGAGPVEIGFLTAGLYELDVLFFESQVFDWGVEFVEGGPSSSNVIPQSRLYTSTAVVPLPAALPLFGSALLGLLAFGWRRRHGATTAA